MREKRELRAAAYSNPGRALQGSFDVFDRKARLKRALGLALPLFGIAVAVIPIPGVHLSSPILILTGVILGVRRLRERERLLSLEGPCPACGDSQRYTLPDRKRFPLTLRCPSCAEFVKVAET